MKFSKIRDVKSPVRGTSRSAGIDFFVPKFDDIFLNDLVNKNYKVEFNDISIKLNPLDRILIPSGIKVKVPENYMLRAANKSGVSSKKGLDILAEIVDEDYQGEIHISLANLSNTVVFIEPDEKIVQFILVPVFYDEMVEVSIEDLYKDIESLRGEGGFGSTGK